MFKFPVGSAASLDSITLCLRFPSNPRFSFSAAKPKSIPLHCTRPSIAAAMPKNSDHRQHHPSLEILGGGRDRFVGAVTGLERPYGAFPVIGWNRHVETIFAAKFRSLPEVRYRRECFRMEDDGAVALDWVAGDDGRVPAEAPTLILLPGLTGGSGDTYVRHMLIRARNCGWRVVVFNSRGCGDSPVTTPRFYSAGYTGDLRQVVKHVHGRYPQSNLYAIGWSIGANILVRFLGEESYDCPLSGGVSLCNPFTLPIADEDFRKGFNNVYDKALTSSLLTIFKKHKPLFEDIGGDYNIALAANARTVREFDEGLTRVSFGFKSADDYYLNASSSNLIKDVRVPLLCIQAANDPIAPARGIPQKDIEENSHCMLIVTPKGGHLGWVAGPEAPFGAPWTDPFVMDFLEHLESSSKASHSPSETEVLSPSAKGVHPVEV